MEARTILLDQADGILTVTLNRPEILNALDLPQWEALTQAFERARDDTTIRALVITGAGRAFSAGADINSMQARGADEQVDRLAPINRAVRLLAALPRSAPACPWPAIWRWPPRAPVSPSAGSGWGWWPTAAVAGC